MILILPITELLSKLASQARRISINKGATDMAIPHMDEFYDFLCMDQDYVISTESWK